MVELLLKSLFVEWYKGLYGKEPNLNDIRDVNLYLAYKAGYVLGRVDE